MILVTGASGLLGSNLILTGMKSGLEMAAMTNRHKIRLAGVRTWQVDLTDTGAVRSAVREALPSTIIHCAAQTSLDAAERDPEAAREINVNASGRLAAVAVDLGASFVYISTDAVFDGSRSWNKETDPVAPLSVYGQTKLDGEIASMQAHPGALIARINIYGWNALPKQSLGEWMLERLEASESFPGFTDVYFCPLLVNDFADVLFQMLEQKLQGTYHVCGSERISKFEFGVRIARVFGLDENLVKGTSVYDAPLVAKRSLDLSMATERVATAIGRRMPSADEGLRRFAELRRNGYRKELKAMVEAQS
jgi:dTDP-4-dehydrorhamnose reductase